MNYTRISESAENMLHELTGSYEAILKKQIKPLPPLPPKQLPVYRNPNECPHCHKGRVRKVRTRQGSYFYGCSRYPQCRYTARA